MVKIKAYDPSKLAELLKVQLEKLEIDTSAGPNLEELIGVQKERCKDLVEMAKQSRYFFEDFGHYDEGAAKKQLRPVVHEPLMNLRDRLSELSDWTNEIIHGAITDTANEFDLKMGKIAQPLRVAVTGSGISPSIDDTLRLLGKDKTINRLGQALVYIQERDSST